MSEETRFELKGKTVVVAGHRGLVGSAVVRRLAREDCEVVGLGRAEADLRRQEATERWMRDIRPDAVIVASATVGGIHANSTYPADFIYDNIQIAANMIHAAHLVGVGKLLYLGSSCIYPRLADQPIAETALLTGPLEPTNESYAIAKIAGIKLCQAFRAQHGDDFIAAMPTNLFGPGDNFHPQNSHVPAALLRRFHEAKVANAPETVVWGTGKAMREFLWVDDLADALVFLLKSYSGREHVNVGTGQDMTIAAFAQAIADAVGYRGRLVFDTSKPDGMPRKVMDVSRINAMGWRASTPLPEALERYYAWFLENVDSLRG